ncbi:MAG TPA: hypothetical protein VHV26_13365 [Rhizomicrobium sp.]|jgi:hypothetical protein|nr:hypothetical protein [Rhizomicrobium sp.]
MKKFTAIAFLAAACFAAAPALADEAGELSIAQTHAGLAGKATALNGVHMHLHHALNCLVGPSGTGFDSGQMNPCAKAGNGAIPDSTSASQKSKLETAVASAQAGIAATDLATAQKDATDTASAIGSAK